MEEIKTETDPVVKPLVKPGSGFNPKMDRRLYLALLIPVILGIISGFIFYKRNTAGTIRLAGQDVQVVNTPTEEGVKDASTFKDTTTGTLQENDGKITTEGTSILIRDGGSSQNVYLTSSVIDLSKYDGKKVQVWGETLQGQKAGWLMDVGRIKVL